MSDEVLTRKIVIIGKTGAGKSATGNTILGHEYFLSKGGAAAVTSNFYIATCDPTNDNCNLDLTIIDTPGLFDTEHVAKTALRLIEVVDKKPHVFLLVMRQGRFTPEDKYTLDLFRIIFGDNVFTHTIIVVTHGQEFSCENDFKRYIEDPGLKEMVKFCGNRAMKIENKTKEFNFLEFRRHLKYMCSAYENKHSQIHKSVKDEFCNNTKGSKSVSMQLEEMSTELGRRLPDWKVPLLGKIAIGVALVVGGGIARDLALTGDFEPLAQASADVVTNVVVNRTGTAGQSVKNAIKTWFTR